MTIQVELAPEDYVRAIRFATHRFTVALSCGILVLFVALVALYYLYLPDRLAETMLVSGGVAVACQIVILLQRYVFLPRSVKRDYRTSKLVSAPVSIDISPDAARTQSEFGQSSLPWSQFLKWKENEEFILVYATKRFFHIYPKRSFIDAKSLQEFRRILSDSVPRK